MKTLTELYKQNTLNFGYENEGITFVDNHKVSFKVMQALGKVMTKINISPDGGAQPTEMIEILMGYPSDNTRETIIKGLGSHYDRNEVSKQVAFKLREAGEIEDIVEATTVVMLATENDIVSKLFSAYLENQEVGDTPR